MRILATVIFALLVHISAAQNGNNGNVNNNGTGNGTSGNTNTSGRENWFPSHGSAGVGTRFPSADLEVVGNMVATQRISAHDINGNNFEGGSLLILNNAIVNGKIGIGISSPTEALDVLGNFRLQGDFSANQLTIQTLNSNSGIFSSLNVNGQSTFNLASFTENTSFSKDLLVTGKIGIGTSSPTDPLHVTGNIRTNAGLFSSAITSGAGQLTSLNVANDAFINGRIGIGINAPTESLDVLGNIKAAGTLSSFSLNTGATTVTTLQASGNSLFNSFVGIGNNTPTEALDVTGNIKASGAFSSATLNSGATQISSLSVSENSIFNGMMGVGTSSPQEKLHVAGNLKVDNTISANAISTTSFQTGAFEATEGTFTENSTFEKNLVVTEKLGIGVASPTESLDINGNLKLTGNVNASSVQATQGSFSNGIEAGNSIVNGSLNVSGPFTASSLSLNDINATNNIAVANDLTVGGATNLTGALSVQGDASANNLTVSGQTQLTSVAATTVSTTGNASIGQELNVAGGAEVNGNALIKGDLQVDGAFTTGSLSVAELNSNGNISATQNLAVTGTSQFSGDANFQTLHATVIEATEFRMVGGGSPFNFENARISETLGIATINNTVPANYKLAVGGNIIATGIDIKIPQKWPDYVFTDGYKLLTLEEVDAFIKKHGHLPGVLSAEEMKAKENYSVSEMDAKILEKVEELTLYIIELKKEIEALKKKSN